VSKLALRRTLGSDLKRVDAHVVKPHEYKELPELTEDMLVRATHPQTSETTFSRLAGPGS